MGLIIEKLTINEFGEPVVLKNPNLDRETCGYFAKRGQPWNSQDTTTKRSCYKCYGRGYITWDNRLESCSCVAKNMQRQGLDINNLIGK